MLSRQVGQLTDQGGVPSQGELGLQPFDGRGQALLVEPDPDAIGPRAGKVRQWRAPPQPLSLVVLRDRLLEVPAGRGSLRSAPEQAKQSKVNLLRRHVERVGAR
jgi:hypothetical protein